MRSILLIFLMLGFYTPCFAQQWVDVEYDYDSVLNVVYGTATNFIGEVDTLKMDIYAPICPENFEESKKPLILIVHGGAFISGQKDESSIKGLCREFVQRGYVAVSIEYRLGFVSDDASWNCNFPNYSCIFAADSAEWHRAYYRAVQDGKGALRYLVNRHEELNIDVNNIFLAGESAGAILALGIGLLDHPSEKPVAAYALGNVPRPHSNSYDCEHNKHKSLPQDISRPDLGSIDGDIEPTNINYTIKGIGNYFGAMMNDLLTEHEAAKPKPAIYSFHQPCDLVVPIDSGKIFKGISWCMTNGHNCYAIQNVPVIYGSRAFSDWNTEYNYGYSIHNEFTNNEFPNSYLFGDKSCVDQFSNPCHDYDSRTIRINQLVNFFAPMITTQKLCDTIESVSIQQINGKRISKIYPNPIEDQLNVQFRTLGKYQLIIYNFQGQQVFYQEKYIDENPTIFQIDLSYLNTGYYTLIIILENGKNEYHNFIKL